MGISITAPVTITKWWNTNFFTNIYNNHYKGIYNTETVGYVLYVIHGKYLTNTFTIKQGFSLN